MDDTPTGVWLLTNEFGEVIPYFSEHAALVAMQAKGDTHDKYSPYFVAEGESLQTVRGW
jgi:hypothetical protein